MSNRELIDDILDKVPADAPLEEFADRLNLMIGLRRGMTQAQSRQGISAAEARKLVTEWATKSS